MIYIDVSHVIGVLARGQHLGGIQRLTHHCIEGLTRHFGFDGVKLIAYDFRLKKLMCAPAALVGALIMKKNTGAKTALPTVAPYIWEDVQAASGDKILLTEWFWSRAVVEAFANLRKARDVRVYQFIHDVLPLALPDYFFKATVRNFRRDINLALNMADVVLTNSEYSRHDLQRICGGALKPGTAMHVLKLPHEFSGVAAAPGFHQPHTAENYALMVGTVEGRKNTDKVIAAWHALYRIHARKLPKLVLVGDFSWVGLMRLKLMTLIFVDRWRGGPVIHVRGCSDAELAALYSACLFSIYVSAYEGWGLPIGESMWFRRPVLSGTATSLPEVGEILVDQVNPDDPHALQQALEKLCFDQTHRDSRVAALRQAKLRTWADFNDSMAQVLTTC